MVDPMGMLLTELRASSPLVALVSTRISADEDPTSDQGKTRVRAVDLGGPIGRVGDRRPGLQSLIYALRCYGPSKDAQGRPISTGPITARQIAGACVDALHQRGPRTDASGRFVIKSSVASIGGLLIDPDTREPYYTVSVEVVAAAQEAA